MRVFTLEVMSESLPREVSEELPPTASSLTTAATSGIDFTAASMAFFVSSVGDLAGEEHACG